MPRLISVGWGRGVEVTVNLVKAERVFGDRAGEVVERILEMVSERCFYSLGLSPRVEKTASYVKVYDPGAKPVHVGYAEREAELIEAEVLSKLSLSIHYATIFRSRNALRPVRAAIYESAGEIPTSISFGVLWEAARALRKIFRYDAAPAGSGKVGVAVPLGVSLEETFKYSSGAFSVEFKLVGYREASPSELWGRRFLKLLVNEKIRLALRARGMLVDRLKAFFDYSVVEGAPVLVRRGYEFSSRVAPTGVVAVSVTSSLSVEARETLSEEEVAPGVRVRRVSDGLSGRVLSVLEGGRCRAIIGGVISEEELGNLVKIYCTKELARIGVMREVLRHARKLHSEWESYVSGFMEAIGRLEVAGQILEFSEKPLQLGV